MTLRPFRGLPSDAYKLWRHGDDTGGLPGRKETAGDPPVAGDLWVAARDGGDFGSEDVALVLLTQVQDAAEGRLCVVAVPVTPADAPRDDRTLTLADTILDVPLVLWPDLALEIDVDVLARRLGQGIEGFTLAKIRAWSNGDLGRAPLPTGEKTVSGTPDEVVYEAYAAALTKTLDNLRADRLARAV